MLIQPLQFATIHWSPRWTGTMKKKPPPGATLIARLKEKRLQREQGSEDTSPDNVLDVEAEDVSGQEKALPPEIGDDSGVEVSIQDSVPARVDLLHRTISIADLQPTTDDYDALTDEIKLAGRFAAVGLIAQGLRLARIRHFEIHLKHYNSFEDYCRNEHQMSATYAYRLIRMSEMAEKLAERPAEIQPGAPDPFERILNLGHRHLMALLPLPEEKVEELLIQGVPKIEGENSDERIPIDKATEKQIRQALKNDASIETTNNVSMPKRAEKMLSKELPKLIELLEQCSEWMNTSPPELELAKMEKAEDLKNLAERFKRASDKIFGSLNSDQDLQ